MVMSVEQPPSVNLSNVSPDRVEGAVTSARNLCVKWQSRKKKDLAKTIQIGRS